MVFRNLLVIQMNTAKVKMNKSGYLASILLDISKTLMYEFQYDDKKPKYQDKSNLCYLGKYSFVIYIKTENVFKDIAGDVEGRFVTPNYEDDRLLQKVIKKNVNGLIKDTLDLRNNNLYCWIRKETYSYLKDDDSCNKKLNCAKIA